MNIEQWLEDRPEWRPFVDLVVVPPSDDEVREEFPDSAGSSLLKQPGAYTSYGVTRLALYVKMRREGQQHRFAEMIASQQPPGCGITDDVFFQGIPRLADQMTDAQLKTLVANAKRHGFTPPADCSYQSALARFPGDPQAFVTRSMGRSYIKKVCEERGWSCEGGVNVPYREPETDPYDNAVPLAADIVAENAQRMITKNPELKKLGARELRRKVLEKHGPSK